MLGSCRAFIGPCWADVGPRLGHIGSNLGRLEAVRAIFGILFFALKIVQFLARRSWAWKGLCWAHVGPSLGHVGLMLGLDWAILGLTLGRLEAVRAIFGILFFALKIVQFLARRSWAWKGLCWGLMSGLHWAMLG